MKIICAWCKKFLGEKEPFDDLSETHAKCTDCLKKQSEDNRRDLYGPKDLPRKETPAEIAANVHQVVSALAEGVLNLARERLNVKENNSSSVLKKKSKGKSAKS